MVGCVMEDRDCGGFTLLETVVVVAIVAVLAMLAYPSMMHYLHSAESKRVRSVLTNANQLARIQSYTTKQNVVLCLADVNNVCDRLATDRVLVFYDRDNNQKVDTDSELVKMYPLELKYGQVEMRASLLRSHMKYFGMTGTPKGHFGHIKYCSDKDTTLSYRVVVTQVGNVWVRRGC